MALRKYVLKRFLQLIPVLIGITFLSFAMMRIAGSDAITEMYSNKGGVSQEIIDAARADLGLDKPFLTQYFTWLGGQTILDPVFYMARGDAYRGYGNKLYFRTKCF